MVVNPGWGDAVQANKAGLLEVADVFVVNKADRPGAAETIKRPRPHARPGRRRARPGSWRAPVVAATAHLGHRRRGARGVGTPCSPTEPTCSTAGGEGLAERRRRGRAADEVTRLVAAALLGEQARAADRQRRRADELADAVAAGDLDPWSAADELLGVDDGR